MLLYAAKLLFQWDRNPMTGRRSKLRLCEERIINFRARSATHALARAKKLGRDGEFTYPRTGAPNRFRFIGIIQLMELGIEAEKNEVWWDLKKIMLPMERRSRILPRENELWVFTDYGGYRRKRHTKKHQASIQRAI